MAAKLEGGGAYLSSFVDVVLKKLYLVLDDDDSFTERNNLLGRLEKSLSDVGPVLDDAEQKQFTNEKVKSWLDDLQDALYKADDLVDELSTEAAIATQRDPGNSYSWSHPVDSYINYSSGKEKVVQRLEYVVARKNLLHLKESAKVDMSSWRTPSTSLVIHDKTRHLSYTANPNDPVIRLGEPYKGETHMRTFLVVHLLHLYELIDITSDSLHLQLLELRCLRALSFKCFCIESLPDSIDKLIHLHYLDLSYTLILTLPESLCKLYNLQTLKLTYCERLKILPCRMQDLVNLRHLDIEGTSSLIEMPKGMSKLKHLNFLSGYILGKQEENGIRELGSLDNLHGSLCISNLKNVNNSREALEAKMGNKKHINILELKWIPEDDDEEDDDVDFQKERNILGELQPHRNLKELSIDDYRGEIFPDWLGLSCYSNLTNLSMYRCKNCRQLPSLGQLPSLEHLRIFDFDGLERIGGEFYNNAESSHQGTPFRSLQTLIFCGMPRWREWHTPDDFDGFPKLKKLDIAECPVLSGDLPAHLPEMEQLTIWKCEELACSLPRAPKLQELLVSSSECLEDVKPHEVVIEETQQAKSVLECLLHIESLCLQSLKIQKCSSAISISGDYLPDSLQDLRISDCSKLTFSKPLQHKSLTEIHVSQCDSLTLFPLGSLPNLKKLSISECPRLASVPGLGFSAPHLEILEIDACEEIDSFGEECLPPSLTTLRISKCEKLERWITSNGLQGEESPLRCKVEGMKDQQIQS
ncbi:hypothetical protein Ahy_A02g005772 [Arachis hypogaea]|uniref:Uncharacterized protein n=1 Tax=Arachis hypogaea TaxID=3818 RepID=A0A445E7T9_ARAHY|nr:hypothetical protein Ahy_A02g005772 [Arachis hypogaea]